MQRQISSGIFMFFILYGKAVHAQTAKESGKALQKAAPHVAVPAKMAKKIAFPFIICYTETVIPNKYTNRSECDE